MISIGTLTIRDAKETFRLHEKTLKVSKLLHFRDEEAQKMASTISDISEKILLESKTASISVSIDTGNMVILFEFAHEQLLTYDKIETYSEYFNRVEQKPFSNNMGFSLILEKEVPNQNLVLKTKLVNDIRTAFNRFTEIELLEKLEHKNHELQKAYEKLKTSQEELLNRTQEMANLGGWEINLNDMSVEWTDQVSRIHELPLDEKPNVEKGITYYAPEARPIITEAVNQAIEKGISYDLELPFITAKGNHRWVRAVGYPKEKNGKVVKLSGLFQDITTKKLAELDIQQKNETLEFKNKELEQFVYIASHDLQEPLRTISNFVKIIDENYSPQFDDLAQKSIHFIKDATERMSERIKALLYYSRIGRSDKFQEVDTKKVIQTALDDLNIAISESNAKIYCDEIPKIKGAENDLQLLFQNLISNALKFSKKDIPPEIWIKAKEEKDFYKFIIKDNGIGIAEEHRERIFKIFQRLHSDKDYKGTGIGLAHCLKIVELHNGKIWVDSVPNQGSSFYFTISKKI